MCKKKCNEAFTTGSCVKECQYRGQMMLEMSMQFNGEVSETVACYETLKN